MVASMDVLERGGGNLDCQAPDAHDREPNVAIAACNIPLIPLDALGGIPIFL